jgi:transposase
MMTTATQNEPYNANEPVGFMAFELSEKTWKLGCTTGHGPQPRERSSPARHQARWLHEVAQAKRRFGLPDTAPVVRCSEAGREGFWRHRFVQAQGSTSHGVDSSAIEVNRRQRRAKSEGLDGRQWLRMLRRYQHGERQGWRVGHGPSVEAEDQRHRHRDLETLKQARASTTARRKGLLRSQGIRLTRVNKLPEPLDALWLWAGAPLPGGLRRRVLRGYAQHPLLREQMAAWEAERRALRQSSQAASLEQVRQLRQLQGIGITESWLVVMALFGWRALKTRREVGGCAGVTPTPDQSGASARDQGMPKSGNRHVRWLTTE